MLAFAYLVAFVGGIWLSLLYAHYTVHAVLNLTHASLSLFAAINLLITLWEIVLFFYINDIKSHHAALKKKTPRGSLGHMFMFKDATISQAFSPRYWGQVWSTYGLLDESYTEQTSFGFWIDVGNGFSMLIPTVIFALGMTFEISFLSPAQLGLLGFVHYYQMAYGTVIYLASYIVNKRWEEHGSAIWIGFVALMNLIWFVFPALGMQLSYDVIMQNTSPAQLLL